MESNFKENRMYWSNLTYFIILLLFATLRLLSALGIFSGISNQYASYIFTIITQIGILFLVPFLIYRLVYKQKPKEIFGHFLVKKTSLKSIFYAFIIGILVYFIIIFVSTFFATWMQIFGYERITTYATGDKEYPTIVEFLLGILFVAVLPGIFEEFSNRGMLMSGLNKGSNLRAVLLSGLLFGLMHLNINQFFYATVCGIILATVLNITKSIWPSVIIHFTNNALNTYNQYASENGLFGPEILDFFNSSALTFFGQFILYMLFIGVVVLALIYLLMKLFEERKITQYKKLVSQIKNPALQVDMGAYNELATLYQNLKNEKIDPQIFIKEFKLNIASDEKSPDFQTQPNINYTVPFTQKMKFVFHQIFPKNESACRPTFKENFFLYASIFLGTVITLFTFIWGLL